MEKKENEWTPNKSTTKKYIEIKTGLPLTTTCCI